MVRRNDAIVEVHWISGIIDLPKDASRFGVTRRGLEAIKQSTTTPYVLGIHPIHWISQWAVPEPIMVIQTRIRIGTILQ